MGTSIPPTKLSRDQYYDKVLGCLVGSAIGDAMGAPFEMWERTAIAADMGYVDRLYPLRRPASPEGPWIDNLPPGGTTDDTRWKYLVGKWLAGLGPHQSQLDPRAFAGMLIDTCRRYTDFRSKSEPSPGGMPVAASLRVDWLREWEAVAKPYLKGDPDAYSYALNRFYGGDLACGGMLYAPILGAYYPADPERAYLEAYRLGTYDLGYARDITGLTAAYVSAAMEPDENFYSITEISRNLDPLQYAGARLVGRITNRIEQDAETIVQNANILTEKNIPEGIELPRNFHYDSLYFIRLESAYTQLEEKCQDIAFHAGEIHLINLTALKFGRGDFQKTLEFVVNFGRDNDTVGAVTGAILGAYLGFKALPKPWVETSLQVNEAMLEMPLEPLAQQLSRQKYELN